MQLVGNNKHANIKIQQYSIQRADNPPGCLLYGAKNCNRKIIALHVWC